MTIVEKTDYNIISNSAPLDQTNHWQSGTSYIVGDKVKYNNKIYSCAVANNKTLTPDENINEWVNMGLVNELKFQDGIINTQTKSTSQLELILNIKDFVNSFAFFNIDGKKISVFDNQDNLIFYKNLTIRNDVSSWWQYFYSGGFSFKNDVWYFSDLDFLGKIKIIIEPNDKGANLGHLVLGKKSFLGKTLWEPRVSIIDYSKKIVDEWGNTQIRKGKTAKYCDLSVAVPTSQVDFVRKTLQRYVGEPTLFIGDERKNGFESLGVFGFYENMEISIPNTQMSELNISIQGVI